MGGRSHAIMVRELKLCGLLKVPDSEANVMVFEGYCQYSVGGQQVV